MKSEAKIWALSHRKRNEAGSTAHVEPRWPLVLAIFTVLLLFSLMPERSRLLPSWSGFAIGIALILLMIGVRLGGDRPRWLRVERAAMLVVATALLAVTLLVVAFLVMEIMYQPTKYAGEQLLTAGIEAWVTNVLAFSIVYWDVDRGGPGNRANQSARLPDWLFPQAGVPNEVAPGWRPIYVDYLFLAFSTATAFSTTDVMPLTTAEPLPRLLPAHWGRALRMAAIPKGVSGASTRLGLTLEVRLPKLPEPAPLVIYDM